ncbi:hypothetical protein Golob_020014 [Gossypium lobatum]|uniref:Uncharacterized protein n=1 Tax=Gossypium lobatum TaxID=34289 RepID=A0A7J8L9E9_9ROSI|nr:hypothetical protein [Gossypium lobatum]
MVMVEVIQIDAIMTVRPAEVSGLTSNPHLLHETVNAWKRGCSRHTMCRN